MPGTCLTTRSQSHLWSQSQYRCGLARKKKQIAFRHSNPPWFLPKKETASKPMNFGVSWLVRRTRVGYGLSFPFVPVRLLLPLSGIAAQKRVASFGVGCPKSIVTNSFIPTFTRRIFRSCLKDSIARGEKAAARQTRSNALTTRFASGWADLCVRRSVSAKPRGCTRNA